MKRQGGRREEGGGGVWEVGRLSFSGRSSRSFQFVKFFIPSQAERKVRQSHESIPSTFLVRDDDYLLGGGDFEETAAQEGKNVYPRK